MSVKKRSSSWEATVTHNGSRYRRSFRDKTEAEIWELEARADLLSGRPVNMGRRSVGNLPRTLAELGDYTYKTVWAGTKSEAKVWINAEQVIKSIGGGTPVYLIDRMSIDNMVGDFKRLGNANATINRKLSALSKMLSVAVDLGVIDNKPKMPKFKEPQSRFRWFSVEEQSLMEEALDHLGCPEYCGLVRVLLDTGMRCGELFGLTWAGVQGNLIVLEDTKNGKSRSIPMTNTVRGIVEEQDHPEGPFCWTDYDKFLRVWNLMKHHLGWSEDNQATPHACRHTFCTQLVQQGVPLPQVARLAGHSTIQMTMRYAQVAPKDLEDAIEKLSLSRKSSDTLG